MRASFAAGAISRSVRQCAVLTERLHGSVLKRANSQGRNRYGVARSTFCARSSYRAVDTLDAHARRVARSRREKVRFFSSCVAV